MQNQDLIIHLLLIVAILFSLSVHEYAHAFVANIFGDPTAKLEGRQTINPLAHWDRIGTTLLVGLLLLRAFGVPVPVFGWGKPVPVNEGNMENPKIQGLQVALAGPMSNFVLAVIFALIANAVPANTLWSQFLVTAVFINVFLMFFNLIPVPPLDGSRILRLFISDRWYYMLATNPIVFFVLLFLVFSFALDYLSVISIAVVERLLTL